MKWSERKNYTEHQGDIPDKADGDHCVNFMYTLYKLGLCGDIINSDITVFIPEEQGCDIVGVKIRVWT